MNAVLLSWRLLSLLAALLVVGACSGNVRKGLPVEFSDDNVGSDAATTPGEPVIEVRPDGDAGSVARDAGFGPDTDTDEAPAEATGDRDLSSDRAKFAGQPRCATLDALLCDDFESENAGNAPDPGVWKAAFGYLPTIDGSRAARGSKSLHFARMGSSPGHIEQTRTFPSTRGRLYGRMFVQFGALPSAPGNAHWAVVSALAGEDSSEVRVGGQARNQNRLGISSRAPGEGGFDWHTPATEQSARMEPSSNQWTCLEWFFGADDKQTRVWVDGQEIASLHLTETEYRPGDEEVGTPWAFPTLERMRIGWWLYPVENPQPAQYDLWIDEVAVDDERIGCVD